MTVHRGVEVTKGSRRIAGASGDAVDQWRLSGVQPAGPFSSFPGGALFAVVAGSNTASCQLLKITIMP